MKYEIWQTFGHMRGDLREVRSKFVTMNLVIYSSIALIENDKAPHKCGHLGDIHTKPTK
jgi:hypothetical protein